MSMKQEENQSQNETETPANGAYPYEAPAAGLPYSSDANQNTSSLPFAENQIFQNNFVGGETGASQNTQNISNEPVKSSPSADGTPTRVAGPKTGTKRSSEELTPGRESNKPSKSTPKAKKGAKEAAPSPSPPSESPSLDDDGEEGNKKRRGNLPKAATNLLKAWLFNHIFHPYPTEEEKGGLSAQTGLSVNQISNWFINARRRILQPMLESARSKHDGPNDMGAMMNAMPQQKLPPKADPKQQVQGGPMPQGGQPNMDQFRAVGGYPPGYPYGPMGGYPGQVPPYMIHPQMQMHPGMGGPVFVSPGYPPGYGAPRGMENPYPTGPNSAMMGQLPAHIQQQMPANYNFNDHGGPHT